MAAAITTRPATSQLQDGAERVLFLRVRGEVLTHHVDGHDHVHADADRRGGITPGKTAGRHEEVVRRADPSSSELHRHWCRQPTMVDQGRQVLADVRAAAIVRRRRCRRTIRPTPRPACTRREPGLVRAVSSMIVPLGSASRAGRAGQRDGPRHRRLGEHLEVPWRSARSSESADLQPRSKQSGPDRAINEPDTNTAPISGASPWRNQ